MAMIGKLVFKKRRSYFKPKPLSLATIYGLSVDFFFKRYLDVSVPFAFFR